jgi:hypothetical protein
MQIAMITYAEIASTIATTPDISVESTRDTLYLVFIAQYTQMIVDILFAIDSGFLRQNFWTEIFLLTGNA